MKVGDGMNNVNKNTIITRIHIFRILVLLTCVMAITTVVVIAFADQYDNQNYMLHEYINAPILEVGTVGNGGAPWRMYSDGVIIVDSGHINWPYIDTWLGPWGVSGARIVFTGPIIAGPYLRGLFHSKSALLSIEGLHYICTHNVVDMSNMFYMAHSLTSLDLSSWDTSNVTNMARMFYGTNSLTSLNVSTWETGNVTDMSSMFVSSAATNLNVSGWQTDSVTNMSNMFAHTLGPTTSLSEWNTENVTEMSGMFARTGMYGQTEVDLDIGGWNTSNVTNMSHMFYWTLMFPSLDLSGWDTSNVTDMSAMFLNSHPLTSLNVTGWDTSAVTNMHLLFANTGITNLDLLSWDTRSVQNMNGMFYISHNFSPHLRQLALGEYFNFVIGSTRANITAASGSTVPPFGLPNYSGVALPPVPSNYVTTGFWQNVGSGTITSPQGSHVFSSTQLIENFDSATMADTWVWQPRPEGDAFYRRITGSFTVYNPAHPVTIELRKDTEVGDIVSTVIVRPFLNSHDFSNFAFENLPPGTYSLIFRMPGHTSFTINNVIVTSTDDTILTNDPRFPYQLPMRPGNVTGSGQVNAVDLNILLQNWMGSYANADLTGLGQINVRDLTLLLGNWMATSTVVD